MKKGEKPYVENTKKEIKEILEQTDDKKLIDLDKLNSTIVSILMVVLNVLEVATQ